MRDAIQEVRELGLAGTLFRLRWEVKSRLPLRSAERIVPQPAAASAGWIDRLPFERPLLVGALLRPLISAAALARLKQTADVAILGTIECFGRWSADFGRPILWHRNPVTGRSWDSRASWRRTLADRTPGDIKMIWEIGRFPHAYHLARAAAFFPEHAERYAEAFAADVRHFLQWNPLGLGAHWASGQEISFRLLAWLFACRALHDTRAGRGVTETIAESLWTAAAFVEQHLDYARFAVRNNHLISEALLLYGAGVLRPEASQSARWKKRGREILDEEAERQHYDDGAYIQQSHNYHRVALQDYLWAMSFAKAAGEEPSDRWMAALERSLDFLYAQQNLVDGRLPNYGANDGALPSPLSTADFSDMRPTLQAVSVLVRHERVYPPGPWDEEAVWWTGGEAWRSAPLVVRQQRSRSFASTGYHVLRGVDPSSFATFRCGTLRDRYSQMDMLHVDVWWRGLNVLVDGGSYAYNAAPQWLNHFMRTASHNTVVVDARDQMVHHRPFKVLYWTKAHLLQFDDRRRLAVCAGEHEGYRRHDPGCTHRRTILYLKDDVWVVIDQVTGSTRHRARLQWLAGEFPWRHEPASGRLELATPAGTFWLAVYDSSGAPITTDVQAGVEEPPRGWLSRYYGHKTAVPSLTAEQEGDSPLTFVTVLSGAAAVAGVEEGIWHVRVPDANIRFTLRSDRVDVISP